MTNKKAAGFKVLLFLVFTFIYFMLSNLHNDILFIDVTPSIYILCFYYRLLQQRHLPKPFPQVNGVLSRP